MPEGDTLELTARRLHEWLAGRVITAATARENDAGRLVGRRVERVEARGKHLLVHLDDGHVVHSHLRMKGSWHVYRSGERWRRPPSRARLVLEAADRVAVCFDAPVLELLTPAQAARHPALTTLGPDVLDETPDLAEVRRRLEALPARTPIGDVLLDQRVAAGIGNIWRCEALHDRGVNPHTTLGDLGVDGAVDLVDRAGELMRPGLAGRRVPARVYKHAGRRCARCGAVIRSERFGRDMRTAYWCPGCQTR